MEAIRTLVWLFRGKLEFETVNRFGATQRAKQIQGCIAAPVYLINGKGELLQLGSFWEPAECPPDEIKMFVLLVN